MEHVKYADITVGTTLPERTYLVDADEVAAYRAVLGLDPGDASVPPMFCVLLLREIRTLLPAPPGGIHAAQRFDFLAPIAVGDRITVSSRIADKYVRNDRNNVVITTTFSRHDGTALVRGTARRIWAE